MDRIELRAAMERLAANHRWTWRPATARLLARIDGARDRHPFARLAALPDDELARLADDELTEQAATELAGLDAYVTDSPPTSPQIAYLSPEFGLSELVPQYSGGLGVLAGDHLKAASDAALPLVGVGLFYRNGFFRQDVVDGQQVERYERHAPEELGAFDTGAAVELPLADEMVTARVWRVEVGRIPLLLLDTEADPNCEAHRAITDRLYGGDRRHRLEQEMVLGVGGVRALEATGLYPPLIHLNEGHAGFSILPLIDREIAAGSDTVEEALDAIRPRVVFTTHTPVPAGIDRFDRALVEPYLAPWAQRWDVPMERLLALGADPARGTDRFNMAVLSLGAAGHANGVSALHGRTSRDLFDSVDPAPPITHVTNGVHARTWTAPDLQELFDSRLGAGWADGDPEAWAAVHTIEADIIRDARVAARASLVELLAARGLELHPDVMVVGFARRFAPYKRANLLLRERNGLHRLLVDDDRPVHFVFAGKAHPADSAGKAILADIVRFAGSDDANGRFTFVPDYHMGIARAMVWGADVWLNNPVRPREASGTSGQKAVLNGGLNCSVRDGWWDEMSDGRNGWDLPGTDLDDPDERDDAEAAHVLGLLAEIAAEYHGDAPSARPSAAWLARMRDAWSSLGPAVTAARMLRDYDHTLYQPALAATR